MKKPRIIVLRTAGTNCDNETASAFKMAGGEPELVHINELARDEKFLKNYQILAIPGGFTYGDDIASGKILANEIKYKLNEDLKNFINSGKLIIGICNGFQVLVKAGILPGLNSGGMEATLSFNDSGSFIDKWVYLKKDTKTPGHQDTRELCVWTKGLKETIYLPIAHGEGKFIPRDKEVLAQLRKNAQIVFKYADNPNGSIDDIAGVCDTTGRILGMMPHPERHALGTQHPRWTREGLKEFGDGLAIFKNGVDYVKEKL
ncbi:MAG: phosphoribosylformylglycinamidine synthase I [Candidatus Omnitrophica bacterium]|nr:phosphoribosylformylglycinamidine synthase I [Candidatus Omnitrophota bacterium]